jgi:3'-phosphoadenosine 5'-phosphosulfate (PAPS) 3'-phosphatase
MREILRSNDAVVISFAQSILTDAGIGVFVADQFMSVAEGSIGAFPRRLLVDAADTAAARRLLTEAGLEVWLINEGEAHA